MAQTGECPVKDIERTGRARHRDGMAEGISQRGYDPAAMDFCEVRPTTPPVSANAHTASDAKDNGEDIQDWNLQLYKRRERLREPVNEAETLGKTDTGGKHQRRRLPSLKPFQYRIVVKPRGGVNLREIEGEVTRSVRAAFLTPLQECPLIRVHDRQNIALICTNNLDDAKELLKIRQLRLQGKDLEVSTYSTMQEEVCRGVIHGVDDGATDVEIEHELLAPGYEILGARRLGKSSSAVVFFSGTRVPYTVRYAWLEKRCFIYRKTRAACFNCGEAGHRTDVCPKPKGFACEDCGQPNAVAHHSCTPTCALCKGPHRTYSSECKQKFFRPDKPGKMKNETRTSDQGTVQEPGSQQHLARGKKNKSPATGTSSTSGEDKGMTSRGGTYERASAATAAIAGGRAWTNSLPGNTQLPKQHTKKKQTSSDNQQSPQAQDQAKAQNSQVSREWPPLPTLQLHTDIQTLQTENQSQKEEIRVLRAELSALKARLAVLTKSQPPRTQPPPTESAAPASNSSPVPNTSKSPLLGDVYQLVVQELKGFKEEAQQYQAQVQTQLQQMSEQIAGNRRYTATAITTLRREMQEKRRKRMAVRGPTEDQGSDTDSTCHSVAN